MSGTASYSRRFAAASEPLHSCSYYAPEIAEFTDLGFKGWWHAYFAYRAAPLGTASAELVTTTFFNFAPRMVERSVPGCWDVMSPTDVRRKQLSILGRALDRIFAGYSWDDDLAHVVEVLNESLPALDTRDRPLFAAWAAEPWPDNQILALWHASTLLREFRFDGHNQALRSADVSGLGSHILMAADGRGTPEIIQKIRGWTATEWSDEASRLFDLGWINSDGRHTDKGRALRKDIELETDRNADPIALSLGDTNAERVLGHLEEVSSFLLAEGIVPGKWPPKHLGQIDPSSP